MSLWFTCVFIIVFGSHSNVIARNSSREICGFKPSGNLYPWLVGFEYKSYGPTPRIECTGALIDRRHVVTKIDCISGNEFRAGLIPKSVRLGPYTTISDETCLDDYVNDDGHCTEVGAISILIEVVIPHPKYDADKSFRFPAANMYDIALIRLREAVTYTDFIKPICLPSTDIMALNGTDCELFITGYKHLTLEDFSPNRNVNHQETTTYLEKIQCQNLLHMAVAEDNICVKSMRDNSSCLRTGGLLMNKKGDRYELVGLLETKTSCAVAKVFNHMYAHVIWIQSEIEKWIHGCGKHKVKHVELIMNGEETKAGDWPWHVAIYRSESYICGGTLISKRTVLTAAHCVTVDGIPASPEILKVILGKYYLIGGNIETQDKDVQSIIVHEEFASRNHLNNDMALLKLKTEAIYNDYVQPACVWSSEADDRLPNDTHIGTVVGWGFGKLEWLSSQLKKANIPLISDITCIDKNPSFYSKVLSNRKKFCAGYANGTSTCNGDSGGGFLMFVPDSNQSIASEVRGSWYIRGIVSLSVAIRNKARCDPYQYPVFTNVASYTDWIQKHVAEELRPSVD